MESQLTEPLSQAGRAAWRLTDQIRSAADPIEVAFLLLLAGVATTGWIALTLAELALFSLTNLLLLEALVAAGSGVVVWRARRSTAERVGELHSVDRDVGGGPGVAETPTAGRVTGGKRPDPLDQPQLASAERGWHLTSLRQQPLVRVRALARRLGPRGDAVFLAGLLVVAGWLYLRPFEFLFGGYDAGGYVMTGVNIARTGAILISDPHVSALTEAERDAVFQNTSVRYPGFYLVGTDWDGIRPQMRPLAGTVVPHGYHLYPSLLAVGYAVGGLDGLFLTTPLLALLSLTGFYLAARRLMGSIVAVLASLLLAFNLAEVWFARYPAAENLVQALLFGGFLAFALMIASGRRRHAVLAGLCFGAIQLTKIEALSLPLVVGGFLAYHAIVGRFRGEYWWFLGTYALLVTQTLVHALAISSSYALFHYGIALSTITQGRYLIGLVAVGVGALLVVLRRQVRHLLVGPSLGRLLAAVGIIFLGLALYGYYLRPYRWPWPGPPSKLPPTEAYILTTNEAVLRLGWYVTEIGILLGALGFALALMRKSSSQTALLLAVFAIDSLVLLYDPRVNPVHFWAARRWLPMVIPGCLLFSAYAVHSTRVALPRRWPEILLPATMAVAMLVSSLVALRPFADYVEYRGAVRQLAAFSAQLPSDGVVIFDEDDAGRRLAAPLHYIWDKDTFIAWNTSASAATMRGLIYRWLRQGRPVYWVRLGGTMAEQPAGYIAQPAFEQVLDLPEILATLDHLPTRSGQFRIEMRVYRVLALSTVGT